MRPGAVLIAAALLLLAGCGGTDTPGVAPAAVPPRLGGEMGTVARPPSRPMNLVERTVATKLSVELREQGLSVDYLDCPGAGHETSRKLTCRGYVDGVAADVVVRLTGPAEAPRFDARLGVGILATENLVRRLAAEGYRRVDCGERSAYPTVVGDQIVCSVTRDNDQKYVVATVTTDSGAVEISDY